MNRLFLLTFALVSCTALTLVECPAQSNRKGPAVHAEKRNHAQWETGMKKALERAKREKKNILVNFTGSDWCGWCVRLEKEVFSTPAFKKYAAEDLILLKIDFPRNKWQTPAEKNANNALAKRYAVRGFPTILLLNDRGDVIARTGYRRGGASAYVPHLKQLQQKRR